MKSRLNRLPARLKRQFGMTLIELLVAMVISLLLAGIVVQVYISGRHSSRLTSAMSRTQESGRFALEFLIEEVRMADFWGCVNSDLVREQNPASALQARIPAIEATILYGVRGGHYEHGEVDLECKSLPSSNPIWDQSDCLVVSGAEVGGEAIKATSITGHQVTLDESNDWDDDDLLVFSNCEVGYITRMLSGEGSTTITVDTTIDIDTVDPWDQPLVRRVRAKYLAIIDNPMEDPALYEDRLVPSGTSQELVDGIERLVLEYGVDKDNDSDTVEGYMSALEIDNDASVEWSDVVTVRAEVLARSYQDQVVDLDPENPPVLPAPFVHTNPTYGVYHSIDGVGHAATDMRIRYRYTATARIRNR